MALGRSLPATSVPVLRLGIKPFGPRTRATFITVPSIDVVARHRLKAGKVPSINCGTKSSPPTTFAPHRSAETDSSGVAKTRIDGRQFNNSGLGRFNTPRMPLDLQDN
jgi:hypothetical protein